MKRLFVFALALLAPCAVFAQGGTTVLGPITTTVSVTASATLAALPSNPSRKAVTICNGSATLIITLTTGTVAPVSLTTGLIIPTGNTTASCISFGTPGLPGSSVGNQINVIANGAGPTNVTFIEYF